jgi:hypothetical protein
MCQIVLIVIMSFMFTAGNANMTAHVGGFISGFFAGLWLAERFERPGGVMVGMSAYEKGCKMAGYVVSAILLVVPLAVILFA